VTELSAALAAAEGGAASSGGSSPLFMYGFLALAVGAFWLMSRRSRKQQQTQQEFRNQLQPGDEVMTASGMIGTVVEVASDRVTLESQDGSSRTQWVLAAIARRTDPPVADDEPVEDAAVGDAQRIAGANDRVIDVPDDLSTLDDRRDDGGKPRK